MVFVIEGSPFQSLVEFFLGNDAHFPAQLKPLTQLFSKAVFHAGGNRASSCSAHVYRADS